MLRAALLIWRLAPSACGARPGRDSAPVPGEALMDGVDAAVIAAARVDGVRPAGGLHANPDTSLLMPPANGSGAVWARRTAGDGFLARVTVEDAHATP